jgi:hypothetical protein
MFRASTDADATFGDKINLSNTTEADQTSDIPVARTSTDAGETFGPMLRLATNGTISATEEEGEETVGGEAVGGEEVTQ